MKINKKVLFFNHSHLKVKRTRAARLGAQVGQLKFNISPKQGGSHAFEIGWARHTLRKLLGGQKLLFP